jgi:hypothetical protein
MKHSAHRRGEAGESHQDQIRQGPDRKQRNVWSGHQTHSHGAICRTRGDGRSRAIPAIGCHILYHRYVSDVWWRTAGLVIISELVNINLFLD